MALTAIQKTLKGVGGFLSKNSPTILMGMGLTGFVSTVVLAVRATPMVIELIKDEEIKHIDPSDDFEFTMVDYVKIAWKPYLPATVVGLASMGCFIGANSIHLGRNAALASAYTLAESAMKEYQAKVIETIGENGHQKVKDDIAEQHLHDDPISAKHVIVTGKGNVLTYDMLSGRYFLSDIESIRKAENSFNKQVLNGAFMSLNEWYWELGLEGIQMGRDVGWTDEKLLDISFSAKVAEDGRPCLVLDYRIGPKRL